MLWGGFSREASMGGGGGTDSKAKVKSGLWAPAWLVAVLSVRRDEIETTGDRPSCLLKADL